MTTLDALRAEILDYGTYTPEYYHKMIHRVPTAPSVAREPFILARAKGKTVLNIGCDSPLHAALRAVATRVYGLDKTPCAVPDFFAFDLERCHKTPLPPIRDLDLVVCGEVLEHLSNPGHFLDELHRYACPVLVTVPNAYAAAGTALMRRGTENVNRDHVAWYSWRTLTTLLQRHRWTIAEWAWYGGKPLLAEGLIALAVPAPEVARG